MAYLLSSLQEITDFLEENGPVFHHDEKVWVARLRVRDSREAIELLGEASRNGLRVTNFSRVDLLATAGFMLQCADTIVDDLQREVDAQALVPAHVDGLRDNGAFIRSRLLRDDFFVFVTDVAQEFISVAQSMRPPFHRQFAKHRRRLAELRATIDRLLDRQVDFPPAQPAPAPVLVDNAPAQPAPAPVLVDLAPAQPAPAPLIVGNANETLEEEEGELDAPALKEDEEEPDATALKEAEDELAAPAHTEQEITEQDSLLLTRNLLRIAICNISYIRGLFPEKYFNDKSVPALEMKIKKLMPVDPESRRLIDWMEKGVFDALQKKYLNTLMFCVCQKDEGPMIDQYAFSFSYSNAKGDEVSVNLSRTGSKENIATLESNAAEVTPDQMRRSACDIIKTLDSMISTLDQMPDERTILMKLLYYDDVTPDDYEPPFFKGCADNEAINIWNKNPLKMEIGSVNSKHLVLALKVKSVLDPCEANNDNSEDENMSLAHESEVRPSEVDRYVVAPNDGNCKGQSGSVSEEDTQDPAHQDGVTRTRELPETDINVSVQKDPGRIPTESAATSLESGQRTSEASASGDTQCTQQGKRTRKASMAKEPILQKYQKPQVQ